MKAHWCSVDEMIVSYINEKSIPDAIKWGLKNNLLEQKPDGMRIGIYFKSKELLDELQKTTCAFSGKSV
jgi:hypothetical protein